MLNIYVRVYVLTGIIFFSYDLQVWFGQLQRFEIVKQNMDKDNTQNGLTFMCVLDDMGLLILPILMHDCNSANQKCLIKRELYLAKVEILLKFSSEVQLFAPFSGT